MPAIRQDFRYWQADWDTADEEVTVRQDLLMLGMRGYTKSGVIGRPSLASAEKGLRLIDALASSIEPRLLNLGHRSHS
jgi:creatinine amidohydrolase